MLFNNNDILCKQPICPRKPQTICVRQYINKTRIAGYFSLEKLVELEYLSPILYKHSQQCTVHPSQPVRSNTRVNCVNTKRDAMNMRPRPSLPYSHNCKFNEVSISCCLTSPATVLFTITYEKH